MPAKAVVAPKKDYTRLWEILAILLVCFTVYGNSIGNGYNIDDAYVVSLDEVNTLTAKGIKGIPEILTTPYNIGEGATYGYRPLGKVTMAIEYDLWGNNPHYSHVVNILLYALNIFLLLLFLRKIAALFGYNNKYVIYGALLLFAVHPIHTEVVCSIKNREEILCFIFMLSALLLFFRLYEERKYWLILPVTILALLAFLSKQTAVNIFPVIALYLLIKGGKDAQPTILLAWKKFVLPIARMLRGPLHLLLTYVILPVLLLYFVAAVLSTALPTLSHYLLYKWIGYVSAILAFLLALRISRKKSQPIGMGYVLTPSMLLLWLLIFLVNFLSVLESIRAEDSALSIALHIIFIDVLALVFVMILRFLYPRISISRIRSKLTTAWLVLALFALIGALSVVAVIVIRQAPMMVMEDVFEERLENAFEQNPYSYSLGQPDIFPTGMQTLFFYLGKMIWPYPLGFYYGYDMLPIQNWSSLFPYLGILLFLLLVAIGYFSIRNAIWRFPLFWSLLALGWLFPFLNLMEGHYVTGIVGERLAYQSSIAVCVILAMMIYALAKFLHSRKGLPEGSALTKLYVFLLLLLVLPYTVLTVNRNTRWVDMATLFEGDMDYLSRSARANFMMASNLVKELQRSPGIPGSEGPLRQANLYLDRALQVYPDYDAVYLAKGQLYFEWFRQPDTAIAYLQHIGTSRSIDYTRAKELTGDIYYIALRDLPQAAVNYGLAYMTRKHDAEVYNKLMQVYFELGKWDSIIVYADTAIHYGMVHAYADKADAAFFSGDMDNARKYYEGALDHGIVNDELKNRLRYLYSIIGDSLAMERWDDL